MSIDISSIRNMSGFSAEFHFGISSRKNVAKDEKDAPSLGLDSLSFGKKNEVPSPSNIVKDFTVKPMAEIPLNPLPKRGGGITPDSGRSRYLDATLAGLRQQNRLAVDFEAVLRGATALVDSGITDAGLRRYIEEGIEQAGSKEIHREAKTDFDENQKEIDEKIEEKVNGSDGDKPNDETVVEQKADESEGTSLKEDEINTVSDEIEERSEEPSLIEKPQNNEVTVQPSQEVEESAEEVSLEDAPAYSGQAGLSVGTYLDVSV